MKASEVLRRYAAGERDFRRTNLRGQSFKGRDLSGADFSEADIQGTNFTNAILKGANFTRAEAGIQKRWLLVQQGLSFLGSALAGILFALSGTIIVLLLFDDSSDKPSYFIAGIAGLGLIAVSVIAITRQGFTAKALSTITITATITVAVAVAVAVASIAKLNLTFAAGVAFASAFAFSVTIAVTSAFAFTSAFAIAGAGGASVSGAVSGAVVFAVILAVAINEGSGNMDGGIAGAIAVGIAGGVSSFLFGIYYSHHALKGNEKFTLIRAFGVAFGGIGGTSFCGADLTYVNFNEAVLKRTSFNQTKQRQTILEWVCWRDAKKLDYARVGNSLLADIRVRELLATRNGYKRSYINANFRASNLDGANLEQADLTSVDFSCSSLRYANLKDANLTEALVLNANFTGVYFTGACVEDWNIDSKTSLEQVDCQYVYLLRNQQERRPSSGDFTPGEFTKLFQEVLSTVDLIFRNGVDWKAFVTAFQQVQVENEDTPLEIQSIENKGDGVVVVRVNVPTDTNKEKIHSEFNQQYELALKALDARYQAELQAKEGEISRYREDSANMWEVIKLQAKKPIHVRAIAEAKTMNNSNDSSQTVNIGGNVTGSTINLGAISGAVTSAINQLPETSNPDQPDLKQLLTQLKEAIEADPDLPDTDKADLLEQVQNLAEAKQTEEPAQKEGLTRRAKKMFEATLKSLPDTAKIVEASSKLLPLILKALGFPV